MQNFTEKDSKRSKFNTTTTITENNNKNPAEIYTNNIKKIAWIVNNI